MQAGIIRPERPLTFVHPVVRRGIHEGIGLAERRERAGRQRALSRAPELPPSESADTVDRDITALEATARAAGSAAR